ncbi:conserved hypothetical protein [Carnobacterium maltaromaticum]|uniref:hypothetical protein n=1 Tax=Carnobacterium maltaromaticum TaxID=2751 RepID=UPI00191B94B6|nr:hypothetical protein [Carnobacterium maltaromaticum]CAD5901935.1 conserved hypothetical protein [Carnobacterium maltaromaticum]
MYQTNQYSDGNLVLVKGISHLLIEDIIHSRYFVLNFNNQIIYLDQFKEEAIVEMDNQEKVNVDFSVYKIENKEKKDKNKFSFFKFFL